MLEKFSGGKMGHMQICLLLVWTQIWLIYSVEYNGKIQWYFDLLPNDKFLDWSKFKAFADDKINVN